MRTTFLKELGARVGLAAAATLLAACTETPPLAPAADQAMLAEIAGPAELAALPPQAETAKTLATLRRVTARYHNLDAALADGFVFLHPCEERPGEGPVGIVYAPSDDGKPKLAPPASTSPATTTTSGTRFCGA